MYHNVGSLLPLNDSTQPKFAQIYFYDTEHELQNRLNVMPQLDPTTLAGLQDMLHRINPYVSIFQQARDTWLTNPVLPISMIIRYSRDNDPRRYNTPTANEVAAIVIDTDVDGESVAPTRDIILRLREGHLKRISELHMAYTPLHYVLLFPRGEDGWHPQIPVSDTSCSPVDRENPTEDGDDDNENQPHTFETKRVTQLEYYSYRLQVREGESKCLHQSGCQFQQYVVDLYASMEHNRLNWYKQNQKRIRSEMYQGT